MLFDIKQYIYVKLLSAQKKKLRGKMKAYDHTPREKDEFHRREERI